MAFPQHNSLKEKLELLNEVEQVQSIKLSVISLLSVVYLPMVNCD